MTNGNLPLNWEKARLNDENLFAFESGIWTGKKPPFMDCPVIRNTNFTNDGNLDLSDVAMIQIERRHLDTKRLAHGDIIVERSGGGPTQPVGRVALFNLNDATNYCFSNFTSRLRVINQDVVDPQYLHLFLLQFHLSGGTETLQRRTTGIRNLDFAEYKNTTVYLPPLSEQRAIVRAVNSIQSAIDARRRELNLERERKAALMQHFFTHGTRNEPIKQTVIGEMPQSWELVRLEEIITITRKPKELQYKEFDRIPFVPMDLIPIGRLFFNDFILKRLDELTSGTYFEPGDILLSKITPSFENGKQGIAENLPISFGIGTTEVIPIKTISGRSNNLFLFYYLLRSNVRSELAGKMEGTTGRQRLNKSVLLSLRLPCPSITEQEEIANSLHACDNRIAALEHEVTVQEELFRAILEELVAGRLSAVSLIESEAAA